MRAGTQEEFEEIIEKAKEFIMRKTNYGYGNDATRPWKRVRAKHDGWTDGSQDIELIMFEGSPAKGYIIINYGTRIIRVFGPNDKPLYKWNLDEFKFKKDWC